MPSRKLIGQLCLTFLLAVLLAWTLAGGQLQEPPYGAPRRQGSIPGDPKDQVRLPNGKLQQDEILKSEHQKNLSEATQLLDLAKSLQSDLDQTGAQNVLSLTDIHKTEEIEKLAKRIRSRMRRT